MKYYSNPSNHSSFRSGLLSINFCAASSSPIPSLISTIIFWVFSFVIENCSRNLYAAGDWSLKSFPATENTSSGSPNVPFGSSRIFKSNSLNVQCGVHNVTTIGSFWSIASDNAADTLHRSFQAVPNLHSNRIRA